ncbi:unnamed protein product, partial [Rotaria magnacalcarata]
MGTNGDIPTLVVLVLGDSSVGKTSFVHMVCHDQPLSTPPPVTVGCHIEIKYQNGDTPTKNFRDLNGGIGLRTIKRWCQVILQSGSITLSSPPGCPRLARTKGNIRK